MSKLRLPEMFDWRAYFEWLCGKVGALAPPFEDFYLLMGELFNEEFVWVLDNDRNRAMDGIDLRYLYSAECEDEVTQEVANVPCSVLEMMVALSMDIDNQIMGLPGEPQFAKWFWMMIDNLKLYSQNDSNYNSTYVRQRLADFMYRRISRNGEGGLFPMQRVWEDQRNAEIWQQANDYLTPYTTLLS